MNKKPRDKYLVIHSKLIENGQKKTTNSKNKTEYQQKIQNNTNQLTFGESHCTQVKQLLVLEKTTSISNTKND